MTQSLMFIQFQFFFFFFCIFLAQQYTRTTAISNNINIDDQETWVSSI